MESKQLSALQQHSDVLAQFIIRMSKFYEGFAADLDNEMQTLRGHLSGKPDFTLAANSINKLNKYFASNDKSIRKYTQDSVRLLEKNVKALQRFLIKDDAERQSFSRTMMALHQPVPSIFALQQLCNDVVQLLGEAIKKAPSFEESPAGVPKKERSAAARNDALYIDILEELNQLVDTYARKNPDDSQLLLIKEKLQADMTQDALLKSCVDILRLIVRESLTEATMTGKVIQSLHNSLGTLSTEVNDSIVQSQQNFTARQSGHQAMREQLGSMEDALEQSESFEKLKADAQRHLLALESSLNEQEQADKDQQAALIDLLTSMQGKLEHLQKQTQVYRKKLAEQIISSQTDTLTQLPNRQAYNERLLKEWHKAHAESLPLAIAVIDIDHFKSINDRFGHAAGDKTLQAVARHILNHCRKDGFVARWGGEEFVVILPGLTEELLTQRLESIRQSLADKPFKFRQEKVSITASLGGTTKHDNDTPQAMFDRADSHLYRAKSGGRNRVITDQDANHE